MVGPVNRRGAALIAVLFSFVALGVMAVALTVMTRGQVFASRDRYQRACLDCLVESAVAHAMNELAKRPDWKEGFHEVKLRDLGTYSVSFGPSVNNLAGETPADGPRGPQSVPPHSADVVVTARSGSAERRAEVIISRGEDSSMPFAAAATNRIRLFGKTSVRGQVMGVQGMSAGLHSNYDGPGGAITWRPLAPGDRALVKGTVSTSNPARDSVDFGTDARLYSLGGNVTGAPKRRYPDLPIQQWVDERQGATDLQEAADETRGGVLALKRGTDYAHTGDVEVNGDLRLADSKVYVLGNLRVNGSIYGSGTVYVTGETVFEGDSDVRANDPYHPLTICSQGSVTIRGFDGDKFLAENPALKPLWDKAQASLDQVDALTEKWAAGQVDEADFGFLAERCRELSSREGEKRTGLLGEVLAAVHAIPRGGKTQNIMERRLKALHSLFEEGSPSQYSAALEKLARQKPEPDCIFPALVASRGQYAYRERGEEKTMSVLPMAAGLVQWLGFGDPGRSSFSGIIYTNGSIYANNKLDIRGALWAKAATGQASRVVDGIEVLPGDIVLRNGVHLLFQDRYVEGLLELFPPSDQSMQVSTWLEL